MSGERKPVVSANSVNALTQLARTLRLVWRLLKDSRVPLLPKLIIPFVVIYVISPIDLVPDLILGLGQLDDVAIIMVGIATFIEFCPHDIVEEHRRAIAGSAEPHGQTDDTIIEGSYREISDDQSDS